MLHRLIPLRDEAYKKFSSALIPTTAAEKFIGVRTPQLRLLAKQLCGSADAESFLAQLPHFYHEENLLHAFLICRINDFEQCMEQTELFLPFIDNWAVCDSFNPPVFKKNLPRLLERIRLWAQSPQVYVRRYAIVMLMQHFLDGNFKPEYTEIVLGVKNDDYYIRMAQAWYFATALAKQWDAAVPYLVRGRLDRITHNKTIQKAVESHRISPQQKAYLKQLRK